MSATAETCNPAISETPNHNNLSISDMFAGLDSEWINVLTSNTLLPLLTKVLNDLNKTDITQITPVCSNIFNFARLTPYKDAKVVIIGQDPYTDGGAHGLSFSSTTSIKPSLRNIYKCLLHHDLVDEMPETSDLTYWAKQGVVLLNASLTTIIGASNAHKKIWKDFTDALIKYISEDESCGPGDALVFVLWGKDAQGKAHLINDDCAIYKWIHPSPLAQASAPEGGKFIDCSNFTELNYLLRDMINIKPIDWDPIPKHVVYTDGACSNNGKGIFSRAGYSAYFGKGPLIGTILYGKVPPVVLDGDIVYGTSQRGEGMGIIVGLEAALKDGRSMDITLVTDSEFWKNMIEIYMPNWHDKGIDFSTKKNHDLTTRLFNIVNNIKSHGALNIIHVQSHNKDPTLCEKHAKGNTIADEYAVMGKKLDNHLMITTYEYIE